jgi:hypothetical protein
MVLNAHTKQIDGQKGTNRSEINITSSELFEFQERMAAINVDAQFKRRISARAFLFDHDLSWQMTS